MSRDKRIWIKLAVEFPNSPKIAGLSDHGFRALVEMFCYCREHLTDGFLHRRVVQRFWPDAVAELTSNDADRPSLVAVDGGWQLHDYLDHQESRAEVEARRERLAANGRKGGRPRKNQVANQVGNQVAKQNETNLPSKTKAESESESESELETLMVTTTCQSSHVTREHDDRPVDNPNEDADGINVWAIIRTVEAVCGRTIDVFTANRLAGEIITRALEPVRKPTAYVQTAIKTNPLEITAMIQEAVA